MRDRSPVFFGTRPSFVVAAVSVGAEVIAVTSAWSLRALAAADVAGFCRTSLASATALAFLALRIVALLGTASFPIFVLVELARGGLRKSLLPGLGLAILLVVYFVGVSTQILPHPPRHPCLR